MSGRRSCSSCGLAALLCVLVGVISPVAPPAVANPKSHVVEQGAQQSSTEPSKPSAASHPPARQEVVAARTARERVWRNADGSTTREVAAAPVRVRRGQGWVPVDLALAAGGDGVFKPKASPVDVQISAGGSGPVAVVSSGSTSIGLGWPGSLPAPEIAGGLARFALGQGQQVEVAATSNGFEQSLVLAQRPQGELRVSFPLTLKGLTAQQDASGAVTVRDAAGVQRFQVQPPSMWDARRDGAGDPVVVRPVRMQVQGAPGWQVLVLEPDQDFFNDPSTQFPVTIDPVVTAGAPQGLDTYMASNVAEPKGTSFALATGTPDAGASINRTLLQFDHSPFTGKRILDANLKLWNYTSGSCDPQQVLAYAVTTDWNNSTTWANRPSVLPTADPTTSSSSFSWAKTCPQGAGFGTLNVTPMVAAWAKGSLANKGMLIRASETNSAGYKVFCSMDVTPGRSCDSAAWVPRLEVTYDEWAGITAWEATVSLSSDRSVVAGTPATLTATLSTPLIYRAGEPQLYRVSVYDQNNAFVFRCFASSTSGPVNSCSGQVPVLSGQRRFTAYVALDNPETGPAGNDVRATSQP